MVVLSPRVTPEAKPAFFARYVCPNTTMGLKGTKMAKAVGKSSAVAHQTSST